MPLTARPPVSPALRDWLATWGSSLVLAPCALYFVVVDYGAGGLVGLPWTIVHALDLLFHEAGHFIFHFFGRFMGIAGGSLMQLLMPAVIAWSTLVHHQKVPCQLALLWLGQSFIDVSVYAADAQARALPLIGNLGVEAHDWHNLLAMTGTLEHTALIAGVLYGLAFVPWALMLALPRWVW